MHFSGPMASLTVSAGDFAYCDCSSSTSNNMGKAGRRHMGGSWRATALHVFKGHGMGSIDRAVKIAESSKLDSPLTLEEDSSSTSRSARRPLISG